MASSDGRRLTLIYADEDPCCFDGASARLLAKYAANEPYDVRIVKSDKHSLDANLVMSILAHE